MTNKIVFLPLVFLLLIPFSAFASTPDTPTLDWFTMFMWLLGGLAIFLYGMELLIKSLLTVAGKQMKNILARLTTNRVMGAVTGAGVTAVIQSSSVTSVLTVGFVSAGLMTVGQAAGVIMGANLGTTVTAQVIAFKVTYYALLMVALGFGIQFFSKTKKSIAIGRLILGLGLIFFGMNVMSEGMSPLREYEPFISAMIQLQNPLLGILAGFVFTALIQSSSATIGIIIVMASNGFLTLPAGIALAMGANIGTTVTALLSTIGKSREALRTGLIHLQFNIFGVLVFLPFIPELSQMAVWLSNHEITSNGVSMAYLAENTPREIANANTLFNLINLIIFLPLVPVFLWVVNKFVPVNETEKSTGEFKADFLDETLINTPSMAMQAVIMELENYKQKQGLFLKRILNLIENPNVDKLAKEDLNINRFRNYQRAILRYLGSISESELSDEEQIQFVNLVKVLHSLDSEMDTVEFNISSVIHSLIDRNIQPSETMLQLVGQLSTEVTKSMDYSLKSIIDAEQEPALYVISIKPTINHLIQEALKHQVRHFKPTEDRLAIFRYEMQLVEGLKQLYSSSKRIARMQMTEIDTVESVSKNPDSEKVD